MAVHNVHERSLPVPAGELAPLLDGLASSDDRLWPHDRGRWPAMRLDLPLGAGAKGGHGPVRYTVTEYVPGRRVRFGFTGPRGFLGFHEYTVLPAGDDEGAGSCVLRHTLAMRVRGSARLSWPLVFRPLHDAVLEDSLDRAELACTGALVRPARWSPYVRLLRRLAVGARRRRTRR
ncbi:SRPBCC family protein [Streptomyces sp. HNM0574]|uniref:SRPBCC family protein n=1 Tax=Streptomyces sp. HNM0574 TaxID=2714954 RepID=UPI00146AD18C|nr:SRPBCC family protein [Streptomyces sp. HNM0574]NLU68949.1 SRPBCC family protein [Streptomyces sp. HNM0574]